MEKKKKKKERIYFWGQVTLLGQEKGNCPN